MSFFAEGFSKVFPMEKLKPFSSSELQLMLSGEQVPEWTKEDVLSYTEPKYGFTKDSPVYQRFVNVLSEMSGDEKKVNKIKIPFSTYQRFILNNKFWIIWDF